MKGTHMAGQIINLAEYYTAREAAEVLSKNSGRTVGARYVRKLASFQKFHPLKINARCHLYLISEVNHYRVEARGSKLARWRQENRCMR